MRHYSNIKARYVWRILKGDKLVEPELLVAVDKNMQLVDLEPLNRNHLGQPFFTTRELAYQKLDQWMTTHENDGDLVLVEIVNRKK